MKITVESLGLPNLAAVIGKKAELDFKGGTVADLVNEMLGRCDAKDRQVILDREGQLDLSIQIMVNEEGFLAREEFPKHALKDGDLIRFILIVGGG